MSMNDCACSDAPPTRPPSTSGWLTSSTTFAGETLPERDADATVQVVERQVVAGLANVSAADLAKSIVAYEPVWAIGTGKTATPAQAQEVHRTIREQLAKLADQHTAERVRILYGGSVKPDNIDSLMAEPDIDGALVGGASLVAEQFIRIVRFEEQKS
jgi:triosephosphate isomerase